MGVKAEGGFSSRQARTTSSSQLATCAPPFRRLPFLSEAGRGAGGQVVRRAGKLAGRLAATQRAGRLARERAGRPASRPARQPDSLPASLPAWLAACLPACQPAS